jgi:hypothetical protein
METLSDPEETEVEVIENIVEAVESSEITFEEGQEVLNALGLGDLGHLLEN